MTHAWELRKGDRVRVKASVDAPAWATTGTVVSPNDKPHNSGDYYLHPSVQWEDGVTRHVADSWLERVDGLEAAAQDVKDALDRFNAEVRRALPDAEGKST